MTVGVGLTLLMWMAAQVAFIGCSAEPPIQLIYLVLGLLITLVGLRWLRKTTWTTLHRRTT